MVLYWERTAYCTSTWTGEAFYWMNIQYFNYTVIIVMRIYFWISRLNKRHLVNVFEKNTIMWWVLETDRILNMNCQVTTILQTRRVCKLGLTTPILQNRTSLQTRDRVYKIDEFAKSVWHIRTSTVVELYCTVLTNPYTVIHPSALASEEVL